MKRIKNLGLVLILLCIGAATQAQSTSTKCVNDTQVDSCGMELGRHTFFKSRIIKTSKAGQVKFFQIPLTKKTEYVVTTCQPEGTAKGHMIVTLYDKNDNFLVSNFDAKTDTYEDRIVFLCQSSGKYVLKYHFEGSSGSCGVSVLGFLDRKKSNSRHN